jgi:multidrug efflux pump subunit AcrA (membrane-fusion protein)
VAAAQSGSLSQRIVVPGTVTPDASRIARVAVKLSGTVAELRKNLGDTVAKDEVIGILESREVADAKSEFLAARLTNELQQDLSERDKVLWEKRAGPEQQYLRSRNLASLAKTRLNIARQKLFALGLTEEEIDSLPDEPEHLLQRQEIRSPIAGQVAERKVDLGAAVPVRIRDVADVLVGRELRTGSASINGAEVVLGTALMLVGGNSRTVAAAAEARIKEISRTLPPGIRARTVLNRTQLVDATIQTVVTNLAVGALVVVLDQRAGICS